jgi:hypothetical protein
MTRHPDAATVGIGAAPGSSWRSILELGRLAPTPHNTQWYFLRVIDSRTAQVCVDESMAIPRTDPNDRFRFAGLGVFARLLEMAPRAAGFELHTTFREPSGPVIARIAGRRPVDEALAVLLRTRQTSRFAYGDEPVSDAAIEAVQALTDRRTTLTITADPRIVPAVLELNNEILLGDLQDKGTSRELGRWIRYTEGSRRRHRNGFTPESLATPAWKILFALRLRPHAETRCHSTLAHHAVPVTKPCRRRRVDCRAADVPLRPVPCGQNPHGCVDHAYGVRLLSAAVRIDHHRRRRTGTIAENHRHRCGAR